jgi:hypothetical protein
VNARLRLLVALLTGSLALAPTAGAAEPGFVTLPGAWSESRGLTVAGTIVGNAAYMVTAAYGPDASRGRVTALTSGKLTTAGVGLGKTKKLGYTAGYTGGLSTFVGSQLFLQRPDYSLQAATLSASGRSGPVRGSPTGPTYFGVLAGGASVGSRTILAFVQNGFGVCCAGVDGRGRALAFYGTGYPEDIAIGVDRRRRVWVSWLDYAGFGASGSTIRAIELDPSTLTPKTSTSTIVAGPFAASATNVTGLVTTCGAVCHVLFANGRDVFSWTPGGARARKVIGGTALFVGAAVDGGGRVLTAYVRDRRLVVRRGNARGSGGPTTSIALPARTIADTASASFTRSRVLVTLSARSGHVSRAIAAVLPLP